jgi:hypothetical protein
MNKLFGISIFLLFGASWAYAEMPMGIQGNVTVINEATDPVPVTITDQVPALAPFSTATAGDFSDGSNFLNRSFDTLPPAGTTFVIEYVSIKIDNNPDDPADQSYRVNLNLFIGGSRSPHHIGVPELAPSTTSGAGSQIRVLGKVVKLYANPDSTMQCQVVRKYTVGDVSVNCNLVGHLVNGS